MTFPTRDHLPVRWSLPDLFQHIAARFGVTDETRRQTVLGMRRKGGDERAAYWFQLAIATGIAVFGLTLDSPGIVIGAMLIAPLMGPIVELAMSLAAADAVLLVRSLLRVVLSIVGVIAASAVTAWFLPFKTATAEILGRTSPTVLDLCVAVLCALAAAFTTVRASSSAASAAAGTSIGISLVPPLCVVGFGLGVADAAIAEGALLLFTANFCAILLCAGLFFAVVGFRSSDAREDIDRDIGLVVGGPFARLIAIVQTGLNSRWRIVWRVGVPFLLFCAVSVPLTKALRQMAWEVRTRSAVNYIVKREAALNDAISVNSEVVPDSVSVEAVIVGDEAAAAAIEQRLTPELAASSGIMPHVRIRAIGANEVPQGRRAAVEREPSLAESLQRLTSRLDPVMADAWRAESVPGRLVGSEWQVSGPVVAARVAHLGPVLPASTLAAVERRLSARLAIPVRLRPLALGPFAVGSENEVPGWWERAQPIVDSLETLPTDWVICVDLKPSHRQNVIARRINQYLAERATRFGAVRLGMRRAARWAIEVAPLTCGGAAGEATTATATR